MGWRAFVCLFVCVFVYLLCLLFVTNVKVFMFCFFCGGERGSVLRTCLSVCLCVH